MGANNGASQARILELPSFVYKDDTPEVSDITFGVVLLAKP